MLRGTVLHLTLPRYQIGQRRPQRNVAETMIGGGACRALFGDPSWAPFEKAAENPFAVQARKTRKGLEIFWESEGAFGASWMPVDVFRADGGWTHRLRFSAEIPRSKAHKLRKLVVSDVTKDGEALEVAFCTGAVELWGGRAILHAQVVFPRNEQDRALWNGKRFTARLLATP